MSALPRVLRYPSLLVGSLLLIASTSATGLKDGMLRVTPAKASDNDIGQFQPRLVSGSVRVRYHGPRRFFQVTTLIWKDGKWNVSGNATGPTSVPLDHQVSVVLQDTGRTGDDTQYTGVVADRAAEQLQTIPFTIEKGDLSGTGRPLELRSIVNAPDDEPVTVWGYAVYADNTAPASDDPIEQQAEKAHYAVIVTVQMLDQPANVAHAGARHPGNDARPSDGGTPAATAVDAGSESRLDAIW